MGAKKTNPSDRDQDDLKRIAGVIRAETLAFQARDFDAWSACFLRDDRTRDVLVSNVAGLSVHEGWTDVAAHMQRIFADRLNARIVDFGQENLQIDRSGDMAWAVFDSWSVLEDDTSLRSFDIRILRRVGDDWKIVFNGFVQREIEGTSGRFLGVDRTGKVVWTSPAGLEALRAGDVLTVSAGRLRARRAEWDKALQASLAQAGRHHGFFETHKAADELGGAASYPVILGRFDDGGIVALRVSIRDCVTYVDLGDDKDLDRRLEVARRVFGLSDGQLRVARRIAEGESLTGLAESLGIRLTTARTHLARIYDKTGVRTRTALVRLLLSVG